MDAKHNTPTYRRHRSGGLDRAFVQLNGKRHYLGRWGSPESREKYDRTVARWLENGRQLLPSGARLTVTELLAGFWLDAQQRYPKKQRLNYRPAIRLLRKLYGRTRAAALGPQDLKVARRRMIDEGWSRSYINDQVRRLRSIVRWGVERDLVPAEVLARLAVVRGLRRGESEARETEPVRPAPPAHVRAVRRFVARQVWAMVQLQRLTAMRPGEVVIMRGCDVDTAGLVWAYSPAHHKTEHHGHRRTIYLGPRAQTIVRPFLRPQLGAYLFSPADAVLERREARHQARRTPLAWGNRPGTNRTEKPRRHPGERYTVDSYRQAIVRACEAASVDPWSPGQLRHNAATRLRREYGLELAQTILGHRIGSAITEIYAEANTRRAIDVVRRIG